MKRIVSTLFARLYVPDHVSSDRCSDSELIDRFVRTNDSAALELLFWRHGPLVWSVCCRILGTSADAEDAFQATFVILARKARSIANHATFAGWLHRVAWRTALTVHKTRSQKFKRELHFENACDVTRSDDPSLHLQSVEQNEILDRELARLPQKYRLPVILCDLESWTRDAAAAELKCPTGTLNSRLSRGREMLRVRLQRCGVAFTGVVAVVAVPSAVPATWQHRCAAPTKSVQQLAESTIRSMALTGARKVSAAGALCGVFIVGTALMAMGITGNSGNPEPQTDQLANSSSVAPDDKKEAAASRFLDPNAGPLPEGAIARIGSNRLRHAGDVTGLKYSPDGKWLASVSPSRADSTARLWDAASGKQQLVVKIETANDARLESRHATRALGFSKDGKQFFVIDMSSFRAFDIDSGNQLWKHAFPKNEVKDGPFLQSVNGAAISPDGKTYVLLQREGSLEIHDVKTGKLLKAVEHSFKMYWYVPIEYTPDGQYIVVGEREIDGIRELEDGDFEPTGELPLPVIEVATGKTISQIKGSRLLVSLRFVPGTDELVGIGPSDAKSKKGVVNLFDWKTGKPLGSLDMDRSNNVLAVSPGGKTLIAGCNGQRTSQVIDINTGKEIARIPSTPTLQRLEFSPDEKLLAGTRAYSGAIEVWDMATHDFHATAAEPNTFFGVRFGPNSNTLAIPGEGHPLLDWRTGKVVERLEGTGTLSPSRKWFARWDSKNKAVSIVDAKTGQESRSLNGQKQFPTHLSFSRDESRLASGSYDKSICVWDLKTGDKIAELTSSDLTGHESIALSENGRIMAVGVNQGLEAGSGSIMIVWDVDAKKQLARITDETLFFTDVAVSPDGKWIAAGGGRNRKDHAGKVDETAVHIWETATGRPVHILPGHKCNEVRPGASCTFSFDSRWLATGDALGKLRIWEVSTGQEVHSFGGHHSRVVPRFSPDSKLLVAASDDAPCFIWDVLNTSGKGTKLSEKELQVSWNDLGNKDAKRAFRAIGRLTGNPDLAVEFIRKNLKPAAALDPKNVERLLGDLEAEDFADREKATEELTRIADRIERTLRQRLGSSESPEQRKRLAQILETLQTASPSRIQQSRALSVLEFIANTESIGLLDELAKGAKDDLLTQSAISARERLQRQK